MTDLLVNHNGFNGFGSDRSGQLRSLGALFSLDSFDGRAGGGSGLFLGLFLLRSFLLLAEVFDERGNAGGDTTAGLDRLDLSISDPCPLSALECN